MRRFLVAGLLLAQVAAGAAVTTVASADPAASVPAPTATAVARRVLITGDSITQGSAGDYTWRYRLWQKLQRTAPATTFVGVREDVYDLVHGRAGSHAYATGFPGDAHAAVWGDTYSREVDRIAGEVAQTRPDVLVVMLGGNDLTYQATPAQTVARAAAYIARARTARPGLDVVVGQATDRYDLWRHQPLIQGPAQEYARGLDALAAQLDTPSQRVVVARTLQGWDAAHDTWDGTHPNPTGESLIAQRVSEALARLGVGTTAPDVSGSRAWSVPGPLPGVVAGSGAATLTWDRARTGASGMYVEERLLQTHEAWHRLPYAMPGNGGTVGLLVPGGLYQLRLVPVKGSSTGAPGPVRQVRISGPRLGSIASVTTSPAGDASVGGQKASVAWARSANASSYVVGYRVMSNGAMRWVTLPYPVAGSRFVLAPLLSGRRYEVRVSPALGYTRGSWRTAAMRRMFGIPAGWVEEALGDSYSAGLGSSRPYTDLACRRTSGAWALKIFWDLRSHVDHLACSGATMPDLPRQLRAMRGAFAARPGQPQLVTMTIGGNDAGFSKILTACIAQSASCVGLRASLVTRIDRLEPRLAALYRNLRRANPYADVMVGGYPDVVEPGDFAENLACARIDPDEREMMDELSARLDRRIAQAARAAGIWSVGQAVRKAFAGHNACTAGQSWIHPPALGYGGPLNPVDSASFHPNDLGQQAYAGVFTASIVAAGVR